MTLLVAGLTGNVFVFGQVKSDRTLLPPLVYKPAQVLVVPGGRPAIAQIRVVPLGDSVRIMRPDHMPCLVPRLRVEPMPVKILRPGEPMPVKQ